MEPILPEGRRLLPPGSTTPVFIPSTISSSPDLAPFTAPCCGQTITGEQIPIPVIGRQRWIWHLCECMERALAAERAAQEAKERRQQYEGVQGPLDQLFPQWVQSAKAQTQTLANFRQTPANRAVVQRVTTWATAPTAEGFLLTGKVGTGKTHLLRGVVWELREQRRRIVYTTVPYLLERLRDQRAAAPSMTEILRVHTQADVVVWDDLGAERPTEWTLDRLYLLVDARYEAEKPLLVSSNLLLSELEATLGARITSRLLAMGPVWEVPGSDYRITQANDRLRRSV